MHTTALALLLAATQAWAVKPFVADYEASWKGVQANAQISLNRGNDNRWNYELSVSNQLGSSRQTTVFEEHGGSFTLTDAPGTGALAELRLPRERNPIRIARKNKEQDAT